MNLFIFLELVPTFCYWKGDWELSYVCTWFWDFPKLFSFPKIVSLNSFSNSWYNLYICIYSICGDNNLVLLRLWWGETTLKDKKKSQSILWGSFWRTFSCFLIFKKVWKLKKCSYFRRKTESFHKYYPAVSSLEQKVQTSNWKNVKCSTFLHFSCSEYQFLQNKSSRDTKISRKFKSQGS